MNGLIYGKDLSEKVYAAVKNCKMTVTDENVARYYPELTDDAFVMESGETSKCMEMLAALLAAMHEKGLRRNDKICALGGGVVGDITGLAASLYMRGIDWVCIPTTLLAMADSCIGGKTAVNFCGVKNLIGAFHRPCDTVVSYRFADTLSQREILCGIGEIVKTCLLTERSYALLAEKADVLKSCGPNDLSDLLDACIGIKNSVVSADPNERGSRKILNVGHTVGHALESLDGSRSGHGEYVLKGIMAECAMFREMIDGQFYTELISLLKSLTSPPRTTANAIIKFAESDKKNTGGAITVMVPTAPGDISEFAVEKAVFAERYNRAVGELKNS